MRTCHGCSLSVSKTRQPWLKSKRTPLGPSWVGIRAGSGYDRFGGGSGADCVGGNGSGACCANGTAPESEDGCEVGADWGADATSPDRTSSPSTLATLTGRTTATLK